MVLMMVGLHGGGNGASGEAGLGRLFDLLGADTASLASTRSAAMARPIRCRCA